MKHATIALIGAAAGFLLCLASVLVVGFAKGHDAWRWLGDAFERVNRVPIKISVHLFGEFPLMVFGCIFLFWILIGAGVALAFHFLLARRTS